MTYPTDSPFSGVKSALVARSTGEIHRRVRSADLIYHSRRVNKLDTDRKSCAGSLKHPADTQTVVRPWHRDSAGRTTRGR